METSRVCKQFWLYDQVPHRYPPPSHQVQIPDQEDHTWSLVQIQGDSGGGIIKNLHSRNIHSKGMLDMPQILANYSAADT